MKPTRGSRVYTPGSQIAGSKSPRVDRVAKQLREEISQLMVREMKDPRIHMASISEVRVGADMRTARVMVSAIGDDSERRAVVTALRHAEGYLRGQLGGRLENLKYVPHLRFELDESIAYSIHISAMLREMEAQETAAAGAADSAGDAEAESDSDADDDSSAATTE